VAERRTYGTDESADPERTRKILDRSYEQTKKAVKQRTVEDKIARLRIRLKDTTQQEGVRAVVFGILDLLGDEL
jgi:hypothetical protein